MSSQQAPVSIPFHRNEDRPQVHVRDPKRLAKLQPGWRNSNPVCTMQFSVNMLSIVDLPGVKPICSLRLSSSCKCALALDKKIPEKTLPGTDRRVIPL